MDIEFLKDHKHGVHNFKKGEQKIVVNSFGKALIDNKIAKDLEGKYIAKEKKAVKESAEKQD